MSRVYCDTNLVVALFVEEAESRRVEAWFLHPATAPVISDLVVLEFSATVARLVREGKMDETLARATIGLFQAWWQKLQKPIPITPEIFSSARALVELFDLAVRWPDALHLAVVRALGLPMATFDVRLRKAAQTLGVAAIEPPLL